MKLYEYEAFPNPCRVRMFLAEKGIEIPADCARLLRWYDEVSARPSAAA